MNKKAHISYSAIKRYNTCSKNYEFHYIKGYREKSVTSYLAFGKAMDAALNAILLQYKAHGNTAIDYHAQFDLEWLEIEINKVKHPLPECILVGYAKQDFNVELLKAQDLVLIKDKIKNYCPEYSNYDVEQVKEELQNLRSNQVKLDLEFTDSHHKLLNFINYCSLRRKAHLMLDAYVRDIIPMIEEVQSVQEEFHFTGPNGEDFLGFIDAVVRFKGEKEFCILDNKTSRRKYEYTDTRLSEQLAVYCFRKELIRAAFAVMLKEPKFDSMKQCANCGYFAENSRAKTCTNEIDGKRCSGQWNETKSAIIETQLLIDSIDIKRQHLIMENITDINNAIQKQVFVRNFDACKSMYGAPCPFMKKCWTGYDNNLVNINDE